MADGSPTAWLDDLRNGDSDAARQIFDHFSKRLCRLAERHLSSRLRQKVDGDDVVQSVFRTFFSRDAEGKFSVDHSDDLWRLLVTITLRKARAVWRKNNAEQRSIGREVSFDDAASLDIRVLSREPTIVEALVLTDEIGVLLNGLSDLHARALELRLAGHSPTEAAALMGLSRQAFYRLLTPLRERLERRGELVDTRQADAGEVGELA